MQRRCFLKTSSAGLTGTLLAFSGCQSPGSSSKRPNLVFVLADQWRAQATGYSGDPNLKDKTPNLDQLSTESINFSNAVSYCPVCTPYRASLITGQYPLTNGLFLNDLCLSNKAVSIAQAYSRAGYDTAYIGKWHLDGHGRSSYIPPERRQGFDYWKVLECTHNYNKSDYYAGDDPTKLTWPGYDAIAQTQDAAQYINGHANTGKPFILFLSWGPPHNPYQTAPGKYKDMFDPDKIITRPNVQGSPQKDLAGYYSHIASLDDCIGGLLKTIDAAGIRENTIFVFTSDHGDMLGSHGMIRKQKPWDESIRVPFLLRYPGELGSRRREIKMPINTPDIMPTLLGLSKVSIPGTVEGTDYSPLLRGAKEPEDNPVLIACLSPFGEWTAPQGQAYRGVRTRQYTYVKTLDGPWLLYDNEQDPYQLNNLVNLPDHKDLQEKMDKILMKLLEERNDEFLPGIKYVEKWGYGTDKSGTIPYKN